MLARDSQMGDCFEPTCRTACSSLRATPWGLLSVKFSMAQKDWVRSRIVFMYMSMSSSNSSCCSPIDDIVTAQTSGSGKLGDAVLVITEKSLASELHQ